jgi:hypothetical protein
MDKKLNTPIHIHKGENYLRYLVMFLLTMIILLSEYSIWSIGFVMIFVIISASFGLISIRFPFMYIFLDYFIIEKKCIFKKYSDRDVFRYHEIKEIEFIRGYMKWPQMILQSVLGQGAYGGFSKADQMVLKFQNGKERIIYRFGRRKEFEYTIEKLQERIDCQTKS